MAAGPETSWINLTAKLFSMKRTGMANTDPFQEKQTFMTIYFYPCQDSAAAALSGGAPPEFFASFLSAFFPLSFALAKSA